MTHMKNYVASLLIVICDTKMVGHQKSVNDFSKYYEVSFSTKICDFKPTFSFRHLLYLIR